MKHLTLVIGLVWISFSLVAGCGDDDSGLPEQTGSQCITVDDCYPDIDHADLLGEVQCLDRVRDGYCTHLCTADTDCCAAEGECETELAQVCAPFESTGLNMCFLSCEEADLTPPPDANPDDPIDEQEFCQREASPDFTCRSSGGGSNNRKVCVPAACGVGAGCTDSADCGAGLECRTELGGGYCTESGCAATADCPADSHCVVVNGGTNYCAPICTTASDCTLCRPPDHPATCASDVTLADGESVSVCIAD